MKIHLHRSCFRPLARGGWLLFAPLMFGSTTAPNTGGTPTPQPYIEQPQPTVTTITSSPVYSDYGGYNGGYYGGYYGGYSGLNYGYSTTVTTYYPRRYFFPPTAPALGEPYVRNRTKSASLVRSSIPLSLSDYVNEPFYSPLSPFLYEESLSKKRQNAIDRYRTAKQTLLAELRAKLASLASADEPTREAQLAEFAREQTPRIMPVEKMAYDIRDDLTHWSLFGSNADWNEGRSWRLGDNTRWESTLDEAKVMRGSAFYQDGLSPEQRRMLRELAMELDDSGREPMTDVALDARGPFFYFSPETSRIRLPANMPADLTAKITAYRDQKAALKKELRDTLYREDRRFFGSRRTAALRELAQKQAPQFAALEPLAEEIRLGLIKLPNPSQPASASLPPELGKLFTDYVTHRMALQQSLTHRQEELRGQFPSSRVEFVKMRDGFGIQIVGNRKLNEDDRSRLEQAKQQLVAWNDEQIASYAGLTREKELIRTTLIKSAGALGPLITPKTLDLILRELSPSLQEQELWLRYREYNIAVRQPGLSPEQRRLLYDAALVSLDLQLPSYTY